MGKEIERKFLLVNDSWRNAALGTEFLQGYIAASPGCTVRVRIAGKNAWLTVKGASVNITRSEFEYSIPVADARQMLHELCVSSIIHKTRYALQHQGNEWIIDEFHGDNAGLIVAEIELQNEQSAFARPDWLGQEVSADSRYANACLAKNPYRKWQNAGEKSS